MDWLTDPFAGDIGRRALAQMIILGIVCGPLGVWVLLYHQSYAAESISHAMLPGLVAAALIGIPLGVGAAVGLAVAAVLVGLASRVELVGADVAVAVAITALFGFGTLLALAPQTPVGLAHLLFGDPLSVDRGDLIASSVLALSTLAVLAVGHRRLTLSGFDPAAAPSLGVRNLPTSLLLLLLLAVTTLIAVQALGNLLVVAIIVGPAAAALKIAGRLPAALGLAAALAIAAGVIGIYLSHHLAIAAGAAIAIAAVACPLLALPLGSSARLRVPRATARGSS